MYWLLHRQSGLFPLIFSIVARQKRTYCRVLAHGRADRDSVDMRIVHDVTTRSGKIIDSQNQVGGSPVLKSTFRRFKIPPNPGGDDDGDGYTNIEELLQQMAIGVENSSS